MSLPAACQYRIGLIVVCLLIGNSLRASETRRESPSLAFFEDFEAVHAPGRVAEGRGIGQSRCYHGPGEDQNAGSSRPVIVDNRHAIAGISGSRSLTITGWFRTRIDEQIGENQCIVSAPSRFSLLCDGRYKGRLGLVMFDKTGRSNHAVWSSWFRPFLADDRWVFFAVTYDALRSDQNVAFYVGTEDAEVVLDTRASMPNGAFSPAPAEKLVIGAHDEEGSKPFHGLLDNLRITAAPEAMTIDQLETVRTQDLQHTKTQGSATHVAPAPASPAAGPRSGRIPALQVTRVADLDRVFPDRARIHAVENGPTHVPRGGVACFQFAVNASNAGACKLELDALTRADGSPLRGAARVYELLPVHVEANNNGGARTAVGRLPPGTWRNALIREAPFDVAEVMVPRKELTIQPGRTTAILVEVDIDPAAEPGLYHGWLRLRQEDHAAASPFTVQVRNLLLPIGGGLSTSYWLSPDPGDLTSLKPPAWWSEAHWDLLENTARTLRAFGQDSIRTPLIGGLEPLIRTLRVDNQSLAFDFSRFDRWCELFLRVGFERLEGEHVAEGHRLAMPPFARGVYVWDQQTNQRSPLFTSDGWPDEWFAFLPVFYDALFQHLSRKGWVNRYVQYQMDEPHDLENYRKLAALARKHLPGVKTQDAVNSSPGDYSPLIDVHVFALTSLAGHMELVQQRRSDGRAVWLYHCCSPYPPYPNRHLDESLSYSRLYPWLAYVLNADGYLYWAANMYRGADPYTSSVGPLPDGSQNPGHPPGDNWFFYPGEDGLRGSLRMVAFREGLIDHQLLKLLDRRDPQLARRIAGTIVRSLVDCETDTASFRQARVDLLDALDTRDAKHRSAE